jgi:hypothetical protein
LADLWTDSASNTSVPVSIVWQTSSASFIKVELGLSTNRTAVPCSRAHRMKSYTLETAYSGELNTSLS